MVNDSPTALLEQALEEVQDHIEAGDQRIKAWYVDGYDPPDGFAEIETAPHQRLMERSAELYCFAANLRERQTTLGSPKSDTEIMLYGIGMERLLSGVHLKLEPETFIETLEESGQTPSFSTCKGILVPHVTDQLSSEQCGMLVLVLEILWALRNNETHLGYHSYQPYQTRRLFLEAACLIQQLYADSEPPELAEIREHIQARRKQRPPASRTVEFDLSVQ